MENRTEVTDKGFTIVNIKGTETFKLGGCAICDRCNGAFFDGKYIGVLNYSVCIPCYEDWHKDATYYEEDSGFEAANVKNVLRLIEN